MVRDFVAFLDVPVKSPGSMANSAAVIIKFPHAAWRAIALQCRPVIQGLADAPFAVVSLDQPQETLLRMIEQIFRPAAVFADFFLINQADERIFVAINIGFGTKRQRMALGNLLLPFAGCAGAGNETVTLQIAAAAGADNGRGKATQPIHRSTAVRTITAGAAAFKGTGCIENLRIAAGVGESKVGESNATSNKNFGRFFTVIQCQEMAFAAVIGDAIVVRAAERVGQFAFGAGAFKRDVAHVGGQINIAVHGEAAFAGANVGEVGQGGAAGGGAGEDVLIATFG